MVDKPEIEKAPGLEADPRAVWVEWDAKTPGEVAEKVSTFEPLDTPAGHAATAWLNEDSRSDVFTVTYLLVSRLRVEGFITCRVSEATLTWSGVKRLGGTTRKVVPAYLLCWCAKHREADVDGEELLLNAVRLARELRAYGCAVLALDPHDKTSSEKVWQQKHGFRPGVDPTDSDKEPRLWLPLDTD